VPLKVASAENLAAGRSDHDATFVVTSAGPIPVVFQTTVVTASTGRQQIINLFDQDLPRALLERSSLLELAAGGLV
jgi:hypothetical protein